MFKGKPEETEFGERMKTDWALRVVIQKKGIRKDKNALDRIKQVLIGQLIEKERTFDVLLTSPFSYDHYKKLHEIALENKFTLGSKRKVNEKNCEEFTLFAIFFDQNNAKIDDKLLQMEAKIRDELSNMFIGPINSFSMTKDY